MNLTLAAYWTRKTIKFGSIGLVVFLIMRSALGMAWEWWVLNHSEVKPTNGFGQLPAINFPKKENLPQFTYKLETKDGVYPRLETVGKVYIFSVPQGSLLALDKSKEIARKMNFTQDPTEINSRVFQFTGKTTPPSILVMDIINGNFKIDYDFNHDPNFFSEKKLLPSDDIAKTEAKNFLQQAGLLTEDYKNGETKVTYWKKGVDNLIKAISLSEADFVRVDLYKDNLEIDVPLTTRSQPRKVTIVSENPPQSLVNFLISGNRAPEKRIVQVNYTYHQLEKEKFETYRLKSPEVAWQEFSSGQGYIANLGTNKDQVTIRKIDLAYYESSDTEKFLQPIFVFEGDHDFLGYLSAVDPNLQAE